MSRCPFWSTTREKVECYRECPILIGESSEERDGEQCIFHECTESNSINFIGIIKEDSSFLNLDMYEDDKIININY
ncbi:MAG: hypothetical protein LLF98_15305 [Clostridium sp.]|uniref:hypothetical protein n=1 Tax=Clostridium sp. TaxID=1506 RepID=UPI0025C2D57E|nr:hypothetical protein [Clostridium sp.]MCE5222553.1 hypothetical protein [Clostridium sp.]